MVCPELLTLIQCLGLWLLFDRGRLFLRTHLDAESDTHNDFSINSSLFSMLLYDALI